MKDINKSLKSFLNDMEKYQLVEYERLPDIELYMEQVLTYLDRYLKPFTISSLDKPITSAMINNYVKGGVIPAPLAKKYSKEHLAKLLEVSLLKKAMNLPNIKEVFDKATDSKSFDESYNGFKDKSNELLHKTSKNTETKLKDIETNDEKALLNLALDLSLEASFNMLISERIMDLLRIYHNTNESDK